MKIFDYLYSLIPYVYAGVGGGQSTDYGLSNPLQAETIQELLNSLLELVYKVGLPIVVIMFVYAGFLYVKARGNKGEIENAHKAFTWTVVGAAMVLGAAVIAAVIDGTIKSLGA